jgi:hypothetical protein
LLLLQDVTNRWRKKLKEGEQGAAVATETVEAAGEGEYKIVGKSD